MNHSLFENRTKASEVAELKFLRERVQLQREFKQSSFSLSQVQATRILELMCLSRFTDEKMAKLSKQNKGGTFQLSAAGHELVGVVLGQMLTAGKDWSLPYYRDQPFAIGLGCDLTEIFGAFLARATVNHSGGRMMPNHFSHKELRMICQSSVVGSQFLHAAGKAYAIKRLGLDEVVYVSAGDGATSQGDFHESLNFSALHQLPVIFVIQNNEWAISVPISEQTAGGSFVNVCAGHHGMSVHEVDGTDVEELTTAFGSALKKAREKQGPSVLIAKVPRLAAHSASDDPKKYKTAEMESDDRERDPIIRFQQWLLVQKICSEQEITDIRQKAFQTVEKAAAEAEKLPYPPVGSSKEHVFEEYPLAPVPLETNSAEKIVIMDAINHALDEEMQRDDNVVVFGQDVAYGKGGVFGITKNLTKNYGKDRCFNTPLAESTIIGIAIGMAMDGIHKPVAEIQFADYLWTGINQLFNEAASIHYRSAGQWSVPIVVRMPCGGYIQGGPYHSQSIEGFLSHCPGLKIAIPSNAADAKGLLKAAIRDPNPVIFLEHKALYRQQKFCAREEPTKDYLIPFGQAAITRSGEDATIVAWGMMVLMATEIAEKLALDGFSVEVLDLRTIVPLDKEAILNSVRKTGKLLVVQEAPKNCGFAAEVMAQVAEDAFQYLDAPIARVCGFDSAVPYNKQQENEVLPQPETIEKVLRQLLNY